MNVDKQEAALPSKLHMQSLWLARKYELDVALKYFPTLTGGELCRILELGAGTGQQAKYLAALGYDVLAIDLPSSSYKEARVYAIEDYDGKNIPADNEKFDVVFSSNVLEHVVSIDEVLAEAHRVLKRGGVAIHIIPSPACRIWSIPAHYVWLARRIVARLVAAVSPGSSANMPRTPQSPNEWMGTFFPLRHGERGNTFTETYYFSRCYWVKKFKDQAFKIKEVSSNGIFYTMANSMGSALSLERRRSLSSVLGASCSIYVMRKD